MRIGLLHSRVRIEERRLRDALAARGAAVTLVHEDEVAFDLRGRGFRDFALSVEAAQEAIERLGYPVVVKPLVGDDGQLLALIEDREAAEAILEHKAKLGTDRHHVYFVQEFVGKPGRDIRVLVIGEEPLVAEYRESTDWAPTRDRKATHTPCALTDEIAALARGAARAFGGGLLEVGLLETARGLLVNDVGTLDDFRGFAAGEVDIAGAIADYVLKVAAALNGRATAETANVGG